MVLATGSYFHSLPKNAITVEGRSSHGRAEGPSKGGGGGGSVMAERDHRSKRQGQRKSSNEGEQNKDDKNELISDWYLGLVFGIIEVNSSFFFLLEKFEEGARKLIRR